MTQPYTFPGGNNTYVPSVETSGGLIIEYSRNPDKFPLNRYIGIRNVDKSKGYYVAMKNLQQGRVVNIQDYVWPSGNDAPEGDVNTDSHTFAAFETVRYAYPWRLDQRSTDQAAWDIVAQESRFAAQTAMTTRTMRCISALTTAGSWSGNTDTATNLGGGKWNASSASNQYIKKTLLAVAQAITKSTFGAVQLKDLVVVINPALATVISQNAEFVDFVKQNPVAVEIFEGKNTWNAAYGLPGSLYGMQLVVEDTVKVTSLKGATTAMSFALADTVALVLARPDGIAPASGPTFNTFTLFSYGGDFQAEVMNDVDNRVIKGRVVEDTAEVLTAPASGYYITACT